MYSSSHNLWRSNLDPHKTNNKKNESDTKGYEKGNDRYLIEADEKKQVDQAEN